MKKILSFAIVALAGCAAAVAQYMPMEKGTVLTFESKVMTENTSGKYTSTVTDVTTSDDMVKVTVVDKHISGERPLGSLDENPSTYTFVPSTGVTSHIVMTAEDYKRMALESVKAMYSAAGQYVSEQDIANLAKMLKPKGELVLTIPENPEDGASFPNSTIRCSVMGQSMGMKIIKGSYMGIEEVEVPAGKFNCVKLGYTFSIIGEGEDLKMVSWYAPKVGIVKQTTTNKKGKLLGEDVLLSISAPAE